jgi:hypothetical protein
MVSLVGKDSQWLLIGYCTKMTSLPPDHIFSPTSKPAPAVHAGNRASLGSMADSNKRKERPDGARQGNGGTKRSKVRTFM